MHREIQEMDFISISKTMTKESKQMKTKIFALIMALKRAVWFGFTKRHFKIFLNSLHKVDLPVSFISF